MSRIADRFAQLKAAGRKGFVPFVTAGDPDRATSLAIVRELAWCGADVIELGVPFSDPMADGPTIQASSQRALAGGTRLADVLEMVADFRKTDQTPIVLFSYLNPLLQYGFERLVDKAAERGVDGILITDAIDDEAAAIGKALNARGLDLISLVAPTTSDARLERICRAASGFIYAVSRAGVTGAREAMTADAERLVERARQFTDLPVAVGFGISTAAQVEDVWRYADAAVVGSAIVAEIASASAAGSDPVERVGSCVRGLLPSVANAGAEI
ncbi:MAG: tryptophan synthase subunit alpha [Pyrinomonadaceae bacterium]